jgi:hypothetical protein
MGTFLRATLLYVPRVDVQSAVLLLNLSNCTIAQPLRIETQNDEIGPLVAVSIGR